MNSELEATKQLLKETVEALEAAREECTRLRALRLEKPMTDDPVLHALVDLCEKLGTERFMPVKVADAYDHAVEVIRERTDPGDSQDRRLVRTWGPDDKNGGGGTE